MLNGTQIALLSAALQADPTMATAIATADDIAIAAWLNTPVAEKCWKTRLTLDEIHDVMDWTVFIGRSVGERDAFRTMYTLGSVNPAQANVRKAFVDIFSGTAGPVVALRAAINDVAQRPMLRGEKTLAGTPDGNGVYTLTREGQIGYAEASALR